MLTPVNVVLRVIPVRQQDSLPSDSRYVFRREAGHDVLYIVDGTPQQVVGDVPEVTPVFPGETPGAGFSRFVVVATAHDTSTYATYVRFRSTFTGGSATAVSNLYMLRGREMRLVVSDIDPGALQSLDRRSATSVYVDARGNLFALTSSGMLCLVRAGRVVATIDVHAVGGVRPAMPGMFSDAANTYFVVPKLHDSENSMVIGERTTAGRYRVGLETVPNAAPLPAL